MRLIPPLPAPSKGGKNVIFRYFPVWEGKIVGKAKFTKIAQR